MNEQFNLVRSFLIASVVVLGLGMGTIGLWVSERIKETASENAAAVAALYVDGVIAPLAQSLRNGAALDEGTRKLLDERLSRGLMNRELHAFKVWLPNGTVAYASNHDLIGQTFELNAGLAAAAAGKVHTEFDQLADVENAAERSDKIPLLEIYSPIRDAETGDVIAIVEFYDAAAELKEELKQARLESWLVVGLTTAAMLVLLSGVIFRGGRLIDQQRGRLRDQIGSLSALLDQNEGLRQRVDQANRQTATLNERHLRRISADIHDGPVQHLAFASLRLKPATKRLSAPDRVSIGRAVDDAIRELRLISRGLTLPELQGLSVVEIVRHAVKAYQSRSGHEVTLEYPAAIADLAQAEKICLYRFIQEALNNADQHAGGVGLHVGLEAQDDSMIARVQDTGAGFDPARYSEGLGLSGLRERLVGLGGTLHVESAPGRGTILTATLPVMSRT